MMFQSARTIVTQDSTPQYRGQVFDGRDVVKLGDLLSIHDALVARPLLMRVPDLAGYEAHATHVAPAHTPHVVQRDPLVSYTASPPDR